MDLATSIEIYFPPVEEEYWDDYPIVVKADIGGHRVHRMYVDNESASEVLHEHCLNRLSLEIRRKMVPTSS